MRTTHILLGMLALSGGLVITAGGCSSDPDPVDPTGVGGGTGGTTTNGGAGGSTTTTGGGGATGDGNDSFEEAEDIPTDGTPITATLDPPGSDEDYYKFTGDAGRLMVISTDAKPESDEFDPAYVDLVVTLYDENEQQIAQNDDPYVSRTSNDPLLWTVLPDAGTYYIKVEECTNAFGMDVCSPVEDITNIGYSVSVLFADPTAPAIVLDAELGNDETMPTDMKYVTSTESTTGYGATFAYGFLADANDIDVFAFTVPASPAPTVQNQLMAAFLLFGPEGPDGMGTTRNIGDAWITDSNGVILSRIDNTLGVEVSGRDVRAPVEPGQDYFLWVQHPGTGAGGHDFYIMSHVMSDTNPLEMSDVTNNALITAEPLTPMANGALESAFVHGTIGAGDLGDHYLIPVPSWFDASQDTVSVACGAQRSGSGLRDLMASVYNSNGQLVEASMTETEEDDLRLTEVMIGANDASIVVKMEAGSQDGEVTTDFYQCGFHFVPATP